MTEKSAKMQVREAVTLPHTQQVDRRLSAETIAEPVQAYRNGVSTTQLRQRYELSQGSVIKILHEHGVEMRGQDWLMGMPLQRPSCTGAVQPRRSSGNGSAESLDTGRATRQNEWLKDVKSPADNMCLAAAGTVAVRLPVRLRIALGRRGDAGVTAGWQAFANQATHANTPAHARADVPSTLTSDEAADQPVPAVRLATERRESDGRFARR